MDEILEGKINPVRNEVFDPSGSSFHISDSGKVIALVRIENEKL